MADSPPRCSTCGTSIPEGAARCPGCGRVFGEENRCPHCHAVSAVRQRGNITVCAACGKPRTGSVTLDGTQARAIMPASAPGRDASTTAMLKRGKARAQRLFGVLALAMGIMMATLTAAVLPGAFGKAMAVLVAIVAVAVGGLSLRAGSRNRAAASDAERRAHELAIVELAKERGGVLTAGEVADKFGVSVEEADATLTRMIGDGSRVTLDVDDEGVIRYVFRELVAAKPRVRVATELDEEASSEPVRQVRRERAAREP